MTVACLSLRPPRVATPPHAGNTIEFSSKSRALATRPRLSSLIRAKEADEDENFGDDLLDFMYAGRKLRRWYGQTGKVLPQDSPLPENDDDDEATGQNQIERDSVVIIDAECQMGEQVILQLILARAKLKILVKDVVSAKNSYGPYVEPVAGDSNDKVVLKDLLTQAYVVLCCGKIGAVADELARCKVPHVLLLSLAGGQAGFAFPFAGGEVSLLKDPLREERIIKSGVPHTIVKTALLDDSPGGMHSLVIQPCAKESVVGGSVSKEDMARVIAAAAQRDIGKGSIVLNVDRGSLGPLPDFKKVFEDAVLQKSRM